MKSFLLNVLLAFCVLGLVAGPAVAAPHLSLGAHAWSSPLSTHSPAHDLRNLLGGPVLIGGAIKVKDLGALSAKFVRNAGNAAQDYKDGVSTAGADWEANTKSAEASYVQGTQDAISRGAFGKGVAAAGAAKYTNNATKLGATRYQPGIANAQDAWARGFGPYAQTLTGVNLPAPGPRGSQQNRDRANAVAVALHNKRVQS